MNEDFKKYVIRVTEEDVDGCGGEADVYVGFTAPLDSNQRSLLESILNVVKHDCAKIDFDTEDYVTEAVKRFNSEVLNGHLGGRAIEPPKGSVIQCPYNDAIVF